MTSLMSTTTDVTKTAETPVIEDSDSSDSEQESSDSTSSDDGKVDDDGWSSIHTVTSKRDNTIRKIAKLYSCDPYDVAGMNVPADQDSPTSGAKDRPCGFPRRRAT